jgi:hypothetical protein
MSIQMIEEPPEAPRYRFDEFVLDVADRQLWRGDARVDLSARYFDALVLLVRERGQLVEKNRFFDEVWSDVVAGAGGAGAAAGALIPLAGGTSWAAASTCWRSRLPHRGFSSIGSGRFLASCISGLRRRPRWAGSKACCSAAASSAPSR